MQVLLMAGVLYRYDQERRAYPLQPGFKFPGLEVAEQTVPDTANLAKLRAAGRHLLRDGEKFLDSLREFCKNLDE